MSLWVKICGNTSLPDAEMAIEAGADALGFVFAPSPRRVSAEQVAAIAPRLSRDIERIGVFVDQDFDGIAATIGLSRLTGVQLHSDSSSQLTAQLRIEFGPRLRILRVVHFGPDFGSRIAALREDPSIDGILVDSRTATAVGGTGLTFDWGAASHTLSQNPEVPKRLIVAGGLNPENVATAIATLAPWGVDVVSGVESFPGRKDRAKVLAFVARARAAT